MLKKLPKFLFARYEVPIILVQDSPPLGFKGEIVTMKPKRAKLEFLDKKLAVKYFPGRREYMFPEYDQNFIEEQKSKYSKRKLKERLEG